MMVLTLNSSSLSRKVRQHHLNNCQPEPAHTALLEVVALHRAKLQFVSTTP